MRPRSDAHALHTLLNELVIPAQVAPSQRWAEVLGCEYNSVEFARRHSEVVTLFNSTVAQISVMPERSRTRFERYIFRWWLAIIAPQHAWSRSVDSTTLVAQEELDQLDSAAELIEARMEGSLAAPTSDDLEPLRVQCAEWIELLRGDDEILPAALRMNLLHDLEHVVWLIEHADMFGVARVTTASHAVVGNVAVVTQSVKPEKRGAWMERAGKMVRTLVAISALLQGIDVGMELGSDAAGVMGELTDRLTED